MAETLVKNEVCSACGVDVRDGTLFCYNCGSSVTADVISSGKNEKPNENGKSENGLFTENISEDKKIAVVEDEITDEKIVSEAFAEEKPKLKSAASMRKRPKTIQRKRIEVVWEEPESAPNVWFLLVAVLLTGFAVGLWFLAAYLK